MGVKHNKGSVRGKTSGLVAANSGLISIRHTKYDSSSKGDHMLKKSEYSLFRVTMPSVLWWYIGSHELADVPNDWCCMYLK